MQECVNHPGREASLECAKRGVRLCDECAVCAAPKTHCENRPRCLIWARRSLPDAWKKDSA